MGTSTQYVQRTVQSEQVTRSAGIVSLAIAISRITGLAREMVMADKFGAGFSYDAFLLAFRIPNLSRDLFAEGSLSSAFIPTFTAALANGGTKEADRLANTVSAAILGVVGVLCALGMLFAPAIIWLLAPGFALVPGKFELAVRLTRIMFPFLLLVALAAQASGMLNACGSFGVPALASTCFNIASVVVGLALGFWLGPYVGIDPIVGMAWGVLAGGLLQLAWQIPRLRELGFSVRLEWKRRHPGLHRIFGLMAPALIANAAVQINVIVNTSFASRVADPLRGHDGPVSWLGYAMRFVQLPLGLFGVAFASALLPSVARSAIAENFDEFRKTISRCLSLIFLFTIPSSVALMVLGRPIVGAIYQSGRFEAYDTRQTALALACYSAGLLAYASVKILNPAFYALSDARTPMYASLLSIAANVVLPLVLLNYFHFGFAALALTTAIAVTLEALVLLECLRRKLGGMDGRYLVDRFRRVVAATAGMAIVLALLNFAIGGYAKPDRWCYLGELAVCLPVGFLAFVGFSRLVKLHEIAFITEMFVTPVRKRLSGILRVR